MVAVRLISVRRSVGLLGLLLLTAMPCLLRAQARDDAMSEREVEKLRTAAYVPADRMTAFLQILNSRTERMQALLSKPRRQGRERDLHDLMAQFGDIAGEMNDNLDELAAKHRDVRAVMPKLLEATDRWATTLRAPADDAAYRVVQRIALDALDDLRKSAHATLDDEVAFFKAHPEAEKAERSRVAEDRGELPAPIDIPR